MFGIFDRHYARKRLRKKENDINGKSRVEQNEDFTESWYCFVPEIVSENNFLRRRILPNHGKRTIYTICSSAIIVPDPMETLARLKEIYDESITRMRADIISGKIINLMGISLGNVLSIRACNELPKGSVENLVSLVGGGRLGFSAWDSILTRHVSQQSCCHSAQEYEMKLEEFSPVNYTRGISVRHIFARFGSSDLLIPYNPNGKELAEALKQVDAQEIDLRVYPYLDHCSTLSLSRPT